MDEPITLTAIPAPGIWGAQVAGVQGTRTGDRTRSAWCGLSPIATTRVAGKKREEKSNSPPGLKFGFWLRKLFGAVKSTNALVLLFLR